MPGTVRSEPQVGQLDCMPAMSGVAVNCCPHVHETINELVAGAFDGAAAVPAGMSTVALQEGHATRLPAMVSGALNFLPHVHRTKIGTAPSESTSS